MTTSDLARTDFRRRGKTGFEPSRAKTMQACIRAEPSQAKLLGIDFSLNKALFKLRLQNIPEKLIKVIQKKLWKIWIIRRRHLYQVLLAKFFWFPGKIMKSKFELDFGFLWIIWKVEEREIIFSPFPREVRKKWGKHLKIIHVFSNFLTVFVQYFVLFFVGSCLLIGKMFSKNRLRLTFYWTFLNTAEGIEKFVQIRSMNSMAFKIVEFFVVVWSPTSLFWKESTWTLSILKASRSWSVIAAGEGSVTLNQIWRQRPSENF